jgi:peroxiredoxin
MAATPPSPALYIPAPDFRLPGTDGQTQAFDDIAGENGTVIVFICNHCP